MTKRPEPDRCDSHSAQVVTAGIYTRRRAEREAAGESVALCPICREWRLTCRCEL